MQKSLSRFSRLALVLCFASTTAFAATSRPSWVVSDIYNYNHPYAATDSTDLATKMSLMNSSAFYFYRGTVDIFYHDTTTLPVSAYANSATANTWLGGDAHIVNFGGYQDSTNTAVFGVNDFDEGYLGQYVWDLRRAATSIVLAGQEDGISTANITTAINTFVAAYVAQLNSFGSGTNVKTFQLNNNNTSSYVNTLIGDSASDSRSSLLSKYTTVTNGVRQFQTSSSLGTVSSATYSAISTAVASYVQTIATTKRYSASYYTIEDIRQRFGEGTGSLGRLRYYVLLAGPTSSTSDDVIIELKQEATGNVAIAAPNQFPPANYANNEGNRGNQTFIAQVVNPNVLSGYTTINGLPFYVQEKSPYQEDFDYTQLTSNKKFNTAMTYFGQALASAHALAAGSSSSGETLTTIAAITSAVANTGTGLSGLQSEISTFAFNYAAQVNLDWQSFQSAYSAGTPLY